VQVEPTKTTLKVLGGKRLKRIYDELLSNVAFKFNLHHYTEAVARGQCAGAPGRAGAFFLFLCFTT